MDPRKIAALLVALLMAGVAMWIARSPGGGGGGESAGIGMMSLMAGDRYVAVDIGRDRRDNVTYVVVRDWPADRTTAERLHDKRFDVSTERVMGPDGEMIDVDRSGTLYFFRGRSLTAKPIKMRDTRDFMDFRPDGFSSLDDVEAYFDKYVTASHEAR